MRVFAKKILREFWEKHTDSEHQLKTWYAEVLKAKWETPNDVKKYYPKASIVADNRVIFNIKGNKYRMVVKFNYKRGWAFIRFIGTHSDYEKINIKKI